MNTIQNEDPSKEDTIAIAILKLKETNNTIRTLFLCYVENQPERPIEQELPSDLQE